MLHDTNVDLGVKDEHGRTAWYYAVDSNHPEIIVALAKAKLERMKSEEDKNTLKSYLRKVKTKDGKTLLQHAFDSDAELEIIEFFLSEDDRIPESAKQHAIDAQTRAVDAQDIDRTKQLLKLGNGIPLKHPVTGKNHIHDAVEFNNLELLSTLVEGYDPKHLSTSLNRKSKAGQTPLDLALELDVDTKIIILLVKSIVSANNDATETFLVESVDVLDYALNSKNYKLLLTLAPYFLESKNIPAERKAELYPYFNTALHAHPEMATMLSAEDIIIALQDDFSQDANKLRFNAYLRLFGIDGEYDPKGKFNTNDFARLIKEAKIDKVKIVETLKKSRLIQITANPAIMNELGRISYEIGDYQSSFSFSFIAAHKLNRHALTRMILLESVHKRLISEGQAGLTNNPTLFNTLAAVRMYFGIGPKKDIEAALDSLLNNMGEGDFTAMFFLKNVIANPEKGNNRKAQIKLAKYYHSKGQPEEATKWILDVVGANHQFKAVAWNELQPFADITWLTDDSRRAKLSPNFQIKLLTYLLENDPGVEIDSDLMNSIVKHVCHLMLAFRLRDCLLVRELLLDEPLSETSKALLKNAKYEPYSDIIEGRNWQIYPEKDYMRVKAIISGFEQLRTTGKLEKLTVNRASLFANGKENEATPLDYKGESQMFDLAKDIAPDENTAWYWKGEIRQRAVNKGNKNVEALNPRQALTHLQDVRDNNSTVFYKARSEHWWNLSSSTAGNIDTMISDLEKTCEEFNL